VERKYSSYLFSTSALDGGEWSASHPGRALALEKGPHCTGGWVGPRAGLDTEATGKILSPLPRIELDSPVVRPVARQKLYNMKENCYDTEIFCIKIMREYDKTKLFLNNKTPSQPHP
jgi:hypothetical protein